MRSTFHAMSTTFNVAWGTPSQFGDRAKRAGYGPFGPNEPEVTTTAQRATRSENGGQSKPCSATVIGNATGSTIGIYAYDADWDVTRQTGNVPAQTAWTVADAQHTPRQRHAPSTPTTTTATPTTTTATMQCVPGGSPPLHSCSSRHERSKCGTSRQFPDHHRAYAGDDPVNGSDPSGEWSVGVTIPEGVDENTAVEIVKALVPSPETQVPMETGGFRRIIDVYSQAAGWLNEVKTGDQEFPPIVEGNKDQADADVQLIAAGHGTGYGTQNRGQNYPVHGSTWWLFPNPSCVANFGDLPSYLEASGINTVQFECAGDADTTVYNAAFGTATQCNNGSPITNIAELQSARTAENSITDADTASEQGAEAAIDSIILLLQQFGDDG